MRNARDYKKTPAEAERRIRSLLMHRRDKPPTVTARPCLAEFPVFPASTAASKAVTQGAYTHCIDPYPGGSTLFIGLISFMPMHYRF